MSASDRTVVCVLTPHGRGAVGVIGVDGDAAADVIDRYFRAVNSRKVDDQPIDRIVYGYWCGAEHADSQGEDLIVCRRSATKLEIHCHGGSQSSTLIVGDMIEAGCVEINDIEWLRLEHDCPLQAAAQQALTQAPTLRTAAILLDQYHGALRQEIEGVLANLHSNDLDAAGSRINKLLEFAEFGMHLTKPWQVVIAGQPNVGKSSLINALVGFERAIVFDQPGTTRDVVTATTAIDGWPVELSDTAGLHDASEQIEAVGIQLARERLTSADLVVWVLDATEALPDKLNSCWEIAMQQAAEVGVTISEAGALVVINKLDLAAPTINAEPTSVATSAVTGVGVEQLLEAIATRLVPSIPVAKSAVPFTQQQIEAIRASNAAIVQASGVAEASGGASAGLQRMLVSP